MGEIHHYPPALLLIAAFSAYPEYLEEGKKRAVAEFGPLYRESELFRFDEFTDYYDEVMGKVLYKQLWTFSQLIDPGRLASIKVQTNGWEEEAAASFTGDPSIVRPLNLDPGYIDLGKLVLASTKDHAHRVYLDQGIFGEITLMYKQKHWVALPWSYPDYQSEGYTRFLTENREYLHQRKKEENQRES
ncbi:MAG: DUF4416 family protein [Planctomycetia bacterium]|nr:DUF4416 family protein [Planctomycetia bacterium]